MYLAVLESLLVFYIAYREWFAWLILVAVAAFPVLSLLLSLPAILTTRVQVEAPERVTMHTPVKPELNVCCKLPAPPVRCRLKLRHSITGQLLRWKQGVCLPADHCGGLVPQRGGVWIYDYLGLWRFPVRSLRCPTVTVLPIPVEINSLPGLQRLAIAWKPKPCGFAENHELRLYRPGDELRQLHWKLSAKTGKLIIREPMEPLRRRLVITLVLTQDPERTDLETGQLLWLSRYLLRQDMPHTIRCMTGWGPENFPVSDDVSLDRAMGMILSAMPAQQDRMPDVTDADWHFHIGGDRHEA